jgi:hypothetical protein
MNIHKESLPDVLGSETTKVDFIKTAHQLSSDTEFIAYTTLSGQEIFQNLTSTPRAVMTPKIHHSLRFKPPIVPALKLELRLFPPKALGGDPSRSLKRVSASDSTVSLVVVARGGSGAESWWEGTFRRVGADIVEVGVGKEMISFSLCSRCRVGRR